MLAPRAAVVWLSISPLWEAGAAQRAEACLSQHPWPVSPWLSVLGTHGGLGNQGRLTQCLQQERLGPSFLERKEEDRGVPAPNSRGWQTVIRLVSNKHVLHPRIIRTGARAGCASRQGDCSTDGGPAKVGGGQHPGQKGQREPPRETRLQDGPDRGPSSFMSHRQWGAVEGFGRGSNRM